MSDEWADADNPRLRDLFRYQLRAHVRYQDGRDSLAPALVFADADYEVGDGTCGLHSDGKQANEPVIVYVRADALIDAIAAREGRDAEVWNAAIRKVASYHHHYLRDNTTLSIDKIFASGEVIDSLKKGQDQ